jgi:hypothetical protein
LLAALHRLHGRPEVADCLRVPADRRRVRLGARERSERSVELQYTLEQLIVEGVQLVEVLLRHVRRPPALLQESELLQHVCDRPAWSSRRVSICSPSE